MSRKMFCIIFGTVFRMMIMARWYNWGNLVELACQMLVLQHFILVVFYSLQKNEALETSPRYQITEAPANALSQ
jgi:hypothetical protein